MYICFFIQAEAGTRALVRSRGLGDVYKGLPTSTVRAGTARADGFGLEQSAYFQGLAFAGAAAGGESLAAISWNPATATFAGDGLLMEASASACPLYPSDAADELPC